MVSRYSITLAMMGAAIMASQQGFRFDDYPTRREDDHPSDEDLRPHQEACAKADAKRARKAEKLKRQAKNGGFR